MEKRGYDLAQILRDSIPNNDWNKTPMSNNVNIPECINTDYCVDTPEGCDKNVLTMAFVNMQPLESVYPNETGFCCGTIFPNLNKPFFGGMKS